MARHFSERQWAAQRKFKGCTKRCKSDGEMGSKWRPCITKCLRGGGLEGVGKRGHKRPVIVLRPDRWGDYRVPGTNRKFEYSDDAQDYAREMYPDAIIEVR